MGAEITAKNLRLTMEQLIVSLKDCPGAESHLARKAVVAILIRFIVNSPEREDLMRMNLNQLKK